jgi:hypothetical protein
MLDDKIAAWQRRLSEAHHQLTAVAAARRRVHPGAPPTETESEAELHLAMATQHLAAMQEADQILRNVAMRLDIRGRGSCPGSGGKEKWRILPVGEVDDQPAACLGGYRRNAPWARVSASRSERMSLSPGVVTSLREGDGELLTFFTFPKAQWKTLRTTNTIERLHEEFRRRVKTKGSLPSEDAALVLLFSLVASGQIKLRRIDGWQKIAAVLSQHTTVAA